MQVLISNGDQDSKSLLQELVQARGFRPPQYITASASGPEHSKTFEVEVLVNNQVVGRGKGASKQTAAQQAAKLALEVIDLENLG